MKGEREGNVGFPAVALLDVADCRSGEGLLTSQHPHRPKFTVCPVTMLTSKVACLWVDLSTQASQNVASHTCCFLPMILFVSVNFSDASVHTSGYSCCDHARGCSLFAKEPLPVHLNKGCLLWNQAIAATSNHHKRL